MKLIFCLIVLSLSILSFARNNNHLQREYKPQKHSYVSKGHWKHHFFKRPIAHLSIDKRKCKSPCSVTFDARKSKAFKGRMIKKYHFNFGDGGSLVTDNPVVTHTYHGNPRKHKWKTTETYISRDVSSLEKMMYKKPKKLKKKNEKVMRGIRKHHESLKKRISSYSKAKKRSPMSLEDINALQKRSIEYKERVQTEAKLKTAR